jgi:ATP-dependent protease HslVU (ClpYQ) peptidase subunit
MTCIVGLVRDGRVYLGGDSASNSNDCITIVKNPKVFRKGEFVMGYTSSWRMGQLIQYHFIPPERALQQDVMEYMVTSFIGGIRNLFKEGGWAKVESNQEHGGSFLVGYQGRLFTIHGDYQVAESANPYEAIGSGANIALGALFVLTRAQNFAETATQDVLQFAMDASCSHNSAVAPPYTFVSTGEEQ